MNKNLGEAPLPIGGWLVLAAVQLMVIMNLPINALEAAIIFLMHNGSGDIVYPATSILLGLACSLPPAFCVLLFFQRKKLFVHSFIVLMALFVGFFVVQDISSVMHGGSFSFDFREIVFVALCIGLAVYMLCSGRVKKTFVFGMKEKAHREDAPPLQIYGWLIVIAFGIAVRLLRLYSDIVMVVSRLFTPGLKSYSVLSFVFYIATFALAVFAVLLFYRRKRLFKICYILLLVALLVPYANDLIRTGTTGFLWFGLEITYAVAATLYLIFSRRVKNTFVFKGFDVWAERPDREGLVL